MLRMCRSFRSAQVLRWTLGVASALVLASNLPITWGQDASNGYVWDTVDDAFDYVFGYTLHNDVSDRGGRGDGRYGSDWLISKSHDTFATMGPFITPKEFVDDVQNLPITFALNGEVLQEGTTRQMIHSVAEQVNYATNVVTLRTGDVIATGTVPGAGSARTPPIFFQPGDVASCTYGVMGTLVNPVEASQ